MNLSVFDPSVKSDFTLVQNLDILPNSFLLLPPRRRPGAVAPLSSRPLSPLPASPRLASPCRCVWGVGWRVGVPLLVLACWALALQPLPMLSHFGSSICLPITFCLRLLSAKLKHIAPIYQHCTQTTTAVEKGTQAWGQGRQP